MGKRPLARHLEMLAIQADGLFPTRAIGAECTCAPPSGVEVGLRALRHEAEPLLAALFPARRGAQAQALVRVGGQWVDEAEIGRKGGGFVNHDDESPESRTVPAVRALGGSRQEEGRYIVIAKPAVTPDDRPALFIKLSWNCGSALEQTSSDSRSTGVLRFGVFSWVLHSFHESCFWPRCCSACRRWRPRVVTSMFRPNGWIWPR
ncbi:hypothetical protein D3C85_606950 [compost metagenome]